LPFSVSVSLSLSLSLQVQSNRSNPPWIKISEITSQINLSSVKLSQVFVKSNQKPLTNKIKVTQLESLSLTGILGKGERKVKDGSQVSNLDLRRVNKVSLFYSVLVYRYSHSHASDETPNIDFLEHS
jgi:hypothetical protein